MATRVVNSIVFAINEIRDTISLFDISLSEVNISLGAVIEYRAELLVLVLSHLEVRIPARLRAPSAVASRIITTDQSYFRASLRGRRGAIVKSWTLTPRLGRWLGRRHVDLKGCELGNISEVARAGGRCRMCAKGWKGSRMEDVVCF